MTSSQSLLPEFDEEMKNTRKLLECVPDSKLDYQPHPKSMNMARLAGHVVEMVGWVKSTVDHEAFDIPPDFQPQLPKSRAELLRSFDKNAADARTGIERTTDQNWARIWSLTMQGKTLLSMPRSAVMRTLVLNHIIHHRAQLGVYLRLNDVAIPGMYGPSADEDNMFQAKNA